MQVETYINKFNNIDFFGKNGKYLTSNIKKKNLGICFKKWETL